MKLFKYWEFLLHRHRPNQRFELGTYCLVVPCSAPYLSLLGGKKPSRKQAAKEEMYSKNKESELTSHPHFTTFNIPHRKTQKILQQPSLLHLE